MESTTNTSQINRSDSPTHHHDHNLDNDDLLAELQSKTFTLEEQLLQCQSQRDEALSQNSELKIAINEISIERDSLRDKVSNFEVCLRNKEEDFEKRVEQELLKRGEIEKEVEFLRERVESLELEIEEAKKANGLLLKALDSVRPVKGCLLKIIESLDDEKVIDIVNAEEDGVESEVGITVGVYEEFFMSTARLAREAELKVNEFKEMRKKEKRELEQSVVSLTEENRDINSLLRVALVEKEAVEKNLNKLKGNTEQKRVALLQIAERGLQRVGFGFMMGSGSTEQPVDSSGASTISIASSATASNKSDSSECEEEVVSLASTVERIMKNLRLEITQLRRSLEESRSENERLQSLAEKQSQEIAENTLYIKELEDRERLLGQNVEELLTDIKESETEVSRWREACELEVEAGKKEVEERDKLVVILKQELEKTKAALETSNGKLKLKEELAATAMAAQAAAEKSLQLADSRSAGLRQRIEEQTKQLEEAETRERRHLKLRHICWPWRAPKANSTNNADAKVATVKQMLPELQALLHYTL